MSQVTERWRTLVAGKKFVWLLMPPWDNVWTRQNQFTLRLAALGAEILYVESPRSWLKSVKAADWGNVPFLRGNAVRQIVPGLHVMSLATQLPGSMHSDAIARINGTLAAGAVKRWMRARGWERYYCWCRVPMSGFALDELEPDAVMYDITDDYGHFVTDARVRRLVYEREGKLLARAQQVTVTAGKLKEKENLRSSRVEVVPNGVDYELFSKVAEDGLSVHPDLRSMRKPVIGFVGLTNSWIDFELVRMLGARWPGQIVMVGPIDRSFEKRARSIPGVQWTGFVRDRADLPRYMKGFDVLIIPFLVNELTLSMNPLKIWEYLASGKPIVSVDLPALEPAREFVDISANREQFLSLVETRLEHKDEARSRSRQEVAARYSWDAIFDHMMLTVSAHLLVNPTAVHHQQTPV